MKLQTKVLLALFMAGFFSPILAIITLPPLYSFYMFLPAEPDLWVDQFRLYAGNTFLILGFVIAIASALALAIRGVKQKQYLHLFWIVLALANPIHQPIFLESLDTYANDRWRDKVVGLNIIGKTPDEIRHLLGKPSYEWTSTPRMLDRNDNITWEGETYTGWDYHVLPFYWLGSKGQVFFKHGKVTSFEANDD